MADSPVVLVFAPRPLRLESLPTTHPGETRALDCRWYARDEGLPEILARERPEVIASFGRRQDFPCLQASGVDVRRRWLHFDTAEPSAVELEQAGAMAFGLFLHRALARDDETPGCRPPLVSVFTPTYRSGDAIHRAFRSLQRQTHDHWEWVLVDDSDDDGATLGVLKEMARSDPRLSIHRSHPHSGRIGEVKRRACALAQGGILVELDHDDELTPNALSDIAHALDEDPRVGFVYSDWAVLAADDGVSLHYGDHWAFGHGRYRMEDYEGRSLRVAVAPPLNAQTLRHIVGVPNHVRAWRRDAYWRIGGHNPGLHVADDYDLLLRTFLHTRMAHIPKLCYLQYMRTGANAQDRRRGEIQRLVRCIRDHYERRLHDRLLELGLPDPR